MLPAVRNIQVTIESFVVKSTAVFDQRPESSSAHMAANMSARPA